MAARFSHGREPPPGRTEACRVEPVSDGFFVLLLERLPGRHATLRYSFPHMEEEPDQGDANRKNEPPQREQRNQHEDGAQEFIHGSRSAHSTVHLHCTGRDFSRSRKHRVAGDTMVSFTAECA